MEDVEHDMREHGDPDRQRNATGAPGRGGRGVGHERQREP
jgi:hypothetical protein